MYLKLMVIGEIFCLLAYKSQALQWTPGDDNQFSVERNDMQAGK